MTSCSWPPAVHPVASLRGDKHIIYFRTLDDLPAPANTTAKGQCFAAIGGAFEVAAALAMNGKAVVMAFPAERIAAACSRPTWPSS